MNGASFDLQTTLIVAGAVLAVVILLWLLLRFARRRQSIQDQLQPRVGVDADPYAANRDRPYMKEAAPPAAAPALDASDEDARPVADPGLPPRREPIDVAAPPVPLPGDFAGIAFPPHSTDHADPLTRLKGVGPKLEAMLNEEGITRYEQLASIDDAALAALEDRLGAFKGRLTRDRVVEQARLLASGDTATFEQRFGKLG